MSRQSNQKILLIDDNKVMHDLARAHLSKSGYQILSAYDASSGLQMVLDEKPDLVLLDFMLPEMNGEKVFSELTQNPRFQSIRNTPVIMLTARGADAVSKATMLEMGISAYLEKPFGLRELTNVIENVFIINDIQVRNRNLRTEVESTRDHLELIVSTVPTGIFSTDADGRITQANRVLSSLLDFERPQSMIGKNVFESPKLRDSFLRTAVARVLTGHVAWRIRNYHHTKGSRGRKVLNIHSVPIMRAGGMLQGVVGTVEDATETQKREEQLQILSRVGLALQGVTDLDDLIHLILTSITAGPGLGFARAMFFILDHHDRTLKGRMAIGPATAAEAHRVWKDLEREHISLEECLEKYGRRRPTNQSPLDQLVRRQKMPVYSKGSSFVQMLHKNKTYHSTAHGADHSECAAVFRRLKLTDFVAVPVVQNERLQGVIIADNLFNAAPIDPDDVASLELLASQTAQALEKAEAYRRLAKEKQKLERAYQQLQITHERLIHTERLAAIGNMAAHVAHEIRNPLVTIGGFARSLQRKLAKNEDARLITDVIADEAIRLEKILANVLEFTKLPKPSLQQTDLNETVKRVITLMKGEAQDNDVQLLHDEDARIPIMSLDGEQIKQLLVNLFKNSFQALTPGGQILVRTRLVSDRRVRIVFRDNGSGIPKNLLDEIFKPFFTTKPSGSGLGLAICRQIANDHGGEISVDSTVGAGTKIVIDLPVREPAGQALMPAAIDDDGSPYLS